MMENASNDVLLRFDANSNMLMQPEILSSTWFPIIKLMERLERGFRMTAKLSREFVFL